MHQIPPTTFCSVSDIFAPLDRHLAVSAILEGRSPGFIMVDDLHRPLVALAWSKQRYYLAGTPSREAAVAIASFFRDEVYPRARSAGQVEFSVSYAPAEWGDLLAGVMASKNPMLLPRQHFTCTAVARDRRNVLPDGFILRAVDQALLGRADMDNMDDLRQEMCSERSSVEDFLANSFGVCTVHDHQLAGWCLSEYNSAVACEVGIETVPAHQRRGLATAMTLALVEQALHRGLTLVGWHCWASNAASVATALKAGFTKTADYAVLFAWFDETDNLAVHGNLCLRDGRYAEALPWIEKATARGDARDWVYWLGACTTAELGDYDTALRYLGEAIGRGFDNRALLIESPHLRDLRTTSGWETMLQSISRGRGDGSVAS